MRMKGNRWLLAEALLVGLLWAGHPHLRAAASTPGAAFADIEFLRRLTLDVVSASRVKPGQRVGDSPRIEGWLMAATEVGRQPDVWGTLCALHLGALSEAAAERALATVAAAVRRRTIVFKGAVRHVPADLDASPSSALERTAVRLNTYQSGAYWHTPAGWLVAALRKRDLRLAAQVLADYVDQARRGDFRRGSDQEAPWECIHPGRYAQNGVYMTSVALPWSVLFSGGLEPAIHQRPEPSAEPDEDPKEHDPRADRRGHSLEVGLEQGCLGGGHR